MILVNWSSCDQEVPDCFPGGPRRVKGSLELQNGGLRALEEALDDFLLEAFFCQVTRRAFTCSFSFNAQRVIRKRDNDDLSLERAYLEFGVSFLTFLEVSFQE